MSLKPRVEGLYTTVKNVSGKERTFGFLGLRGLRLGIDETVTIPGNVISALGGTRSQRKFQALQRALTGNNGERAASLAIVSTPIVCVAGAGVTKGIGFDGTNLGTVDPSWTWGGKGSSDFVAAT